MKILIALSMVLFFLLGCASTTLIKSNPPGAKLQVDGRSLGETPHFYTDKAVAGTTKAVTLKKEGYKDFNGYIKTGKVIGSCSNRRNFPNRAFCLGSGVSISI